MENGLVYLAVLWLKRRKRRGIGAGAYLDSGRKKKQKKNSRTLCCSWKDGSRFQGFPRGDNTGNMELVAMFSSGGKQTD